MASIFSAHVNVADSMDSDTVLVGLFNTEAEAASAGEKYAAVFTALDNPHVTADAFTLEHVIGEVDNPLEHFIYINNMDEDYPEEPDGETDPTPAYAKATNDWICPACGATNTSRIASGRVKCDVCNADWSWADLYSEEVVDDQNYGPNKDGSNEQ